MIIDAHTHLFPDEVRKRRQAFCSRDEGFRLIYGNEKARLSSPEDLLANMDREGVDQSVICGFPWKDPGLCREGNEYLLHCYTRHPRRLIPLACLPLGPLRAAGRELEWSLSRGMRGIGELAFYREGLSPGILRRLTGLFSSLSGREVPLLLHVNEPVGHEYPGKILMTLQPIFHLLRSLPDVPIILAHWGGGLFFYELMPEIARAAGKAYYDTAASPYLYRPEIYPLAVKIIGPDRILFGSDFPLLPPGRYFREMETVRLPDSARRMIQGENARRLWNSSGAHREDRVK